MYRQSEKKLLTSNTFSTYPHTMVNFGPLIAEIHSGVWGTPANFNGFHVLAALNSNIFSTCSYNMVNLGPLAAEIGLQVWGTPVNFNEFRVFASLLNQCRSTEVTQTLHNVWLSPALLRYIYIFRGFCP